MEGIARRRLGLGMVAALAVLLAACGGGGDSSTSGTTPAADTAPAASTAAAAAATTASTEPVTLTIDTFGDFGYKQLIADYVKLHPNVTVKEIQQEYNQHHQQLAQHLAAGSGAADIVAIDEGFIVQFRSTRRQVREPAGPRRRRPQGPWLPWKWRQSMSADGKTQIGLGTDVGGLAMCYRTRPVEAAGLPGDRDEVVRAVARPGTTSSPPARSSRRPARARSGSTPPPTCYNPILAPAAGRLLRHLRQLVFDTNPGIKTAWDSTMDMIDDGRVGQPAAFSPEWNAGFKKGEFATVACPAWMQGYIKDQARRHGGKWDVAAIPGGGGNWGGSFLAVPRSEEPEEAYKLVDWLIAPEQQIEIFKKVGNLPSSRPSTRTRRSPDVQEPVLQRRAGRPDLRRHRERAAAAVPGHEERPDPGRPSRTSLRERRERLEVGRRRLGEGGEGRREGGRVIGRCTAGSRERIRRIPSPGAGPRRSRFRHPVDVPSPPGRRAAPGGSLTRDVRRRTS